MKKTKKKLKKSVKNPLSFNSSSVEIIASSEYKTAESNIIKNDGDLVSKNKKNKQIIEEKYDNISKIFRKTSKFFHSIKTEYTRIVWPKKSEVISITMLVGIVSLFISLFFMFTDYISYNVIDFFIMNKF